MALLRAAEAVGNVVRDVPPIPGRVKLTDTLKQGAVKSKNVQITESLTTKLNNVVDKPVFVIRLAKLSNVEFDLIGLSEDKINERIDARLKLIREKGGNDANIKRLNEHREILKDIKLTISLTEAEARFVTPSNLLRSNLKPYLEDLVELGRMASVKVGDRVTMEYAQNFLVAKITHFEHYMKAVETRYMHLIQLFSVGKPGLTPVPDGTLINDIQPLVHHPRQWATLISPRKILDCRGTAGKNLTKDEKTSVLTWVAMVEATIMTLAGIAQPKQFTLERFDSEKKITGYWQQMVESYKALNKKIVELKGPNEDGEAYVPWNEVHVDQYNIDHLFKKVNIDAGSFVGNKNPKKQ